MKAFKISLVAAFNGDEVTPEQISDGIFSAMRAVAPGLAMLNVESVKAIKDAEAKVARLVEEFGAETPSVVEDGVLAAKKTRSAGGQRKRAKK